MKLVTVLAVFFLTVFAAPAEIKLPTSVRKDISKQVKDFDKSIDFDKSKFTLNTHDFGLKNDSVVIRTLSQDGCTVNEPALRYIKTKLRTKVKGISTCDVHVRPSPSILRKVKSIFSKKTHPDPALYCRYNCTNGKADHFEYAGTEKRNWYYY